MGLDFNHPARFPVRVKGNPGIPSVSNKDLLVVDRSLNPENNSVVIAIVNEEFVVSRFVQTKDETYLLKYNKKEYDFEIWGVVSHSVHSLKK